MRPGFGISGVMLLIWTLFLLSRLIPSMLRGRKARKLERVAASWPSVPGIVRGASVKMANMRWRLTLTYDAFASGHGIDLWERDFPLKPQAEHAAKVLTSQACQVHCNPQDDKQTTLLWSELSYVLAHDPYAPHLVPMGRIGYRWLVALAAFAVAGFSASVVLFCIGMSGLNACVCQAITWLLLASPATMILSFLPMARVLVVAPQNSPWKRLRFVLPGWRLWAIGLAVLAAAFSLAHYGPMFRALPMDADIPDKVFAGTIGAVIIPVDLFSALMAVMGLERLRPMEDAARMPTAV